MCYEQACEGRLNGLHAVPHAPCNSFFRCFNGALVKVEECPKHQIFDGRRCVAERNFSCWSEGRGSCEGLEDGFHVSPDSGCRGFYLCHQSQFIRAYKCSPGLVFNGKECVDDRNYICSVRSRLPDCSTKVDGYYTGEKSGCRTFFYCRGGSQLSEHTCPGDNVFNGEQCVDPSLFRCPARPEEHQQPGNFTSNVVRSRRSSDFDCGSRDDGFYIDEASKCRRFFHCQDGRKDSNGTCPHTRVFNGRQCVPEEEFECPITPEDCEGRADGFYFDVTSSCRRYYHCSDGQRDSSGTCPQSEVFNGLQCVSEEEYECPISPEDEECKLRGNGVYQDLTNGCRSYFQCLDGVRTLSRCPEGELHDGEACRAAHDVFCPPSSLCDSRPDGLFADTSRGCQGYFECAGGAVVGYGSCGPGEEHDGRECVSRLLSSCPGRESEAGQYLGKRTATLNDFETRNSIVAGGGSKALSFLRESINLLNFLGPLRAMNVLPTRGSSAAARDAEGPRRAQGGLKGFKSVHQKEESKVMKLLVALTNNEQPTPRYLAGKASTRAASQAPPPTQAAPPRPAVPAASASHQGTAPTHPL